MHIRRLILAVATLLISITVFAATVEVKDVPSAIMGKTIKATYVVPEGYQQGTARYPVIYLLHGAGGDHNNWINSKAPLRQLADADQLIIVCPNGSADSWYFDSPIDKSSQYETFTASELVKFTDDTYRTIATPQGRAITGLSMGGHGALFLAFRHKDVFGAAGSMSGGVDLRPFPNNWNIKGRIGTIEEFPQRWEELSVVNNVNRIKNGDLALIIDCGVNDFFIAVNRNLHDILLKAGVGHDYIERPGGHSWDYWSNAVQYQILFFQSYFQKNAVKPK